MDWLQKWAGIGVSALANPCAETPPKSAKYLMAIIEVFVRCKASIVMKKKPRVLRERSTFIIDHVLGSNKSRREVNMLNNVRRHLHSKSELRSTQHRCVKEPQVSQSEHAFEEEQDCVEVYD